MTKQAKINRANELGRKAYQNDQPCVPANNKEVMEMGLSMNGIGNGAADIFKAFNEGWQELHAEFMEKKIAELKSN